MQYYCNMKNSYNWVSWCHLSCDKTPSLSSFFLFLILISAHSWSYIFIERHAHCTYIVYFSFLLFADGLVGLIKYDSLLLLQFLRSCQELDMPYACGSRNYERLLEGAEVLSVVVLLFHIHSQNFQATYVHSLLDETFY